MMQEMTVQAKDLRAGDRMVTETVQGGNVAVLVCGVFIHNWSTRQDKVTVYCRDADFEYGGADFVTVQRGY